MSEFFEIYQGYPVWLEHSEIAKRLSVRVES